jgi:hypothetical protein
MCGAVGLVLVPVVGTAPAGAGSSGPPGGDTIAVNVRGLADNESTDFGHMVFTVPMYSLVTGGTAGSLTDDITCAFALAPPCTVFDIETTYHLPGGDIVNEGRWSAVFDLAHPGFALAGTRPDDDTIVSGTGDYAGAGGRVNGWGVVDVHDLPDELGYDMFTVIRLAPGGDMVLGTGDRLADTPPATRIPQYFTSDGDNSSSELTHFVAHTTLFSLGRAQRFGAAVDDITCAFGPPPCGVLDVVTHFAYDGGELEVHSEVSLVPDPQRPGYGLVGARPDHDTITRSSGVFGGRTGRVPISGAVDLRRFPAEAPFEGVSLISLAP